MPDHIKASIERLFHKIPAMKFPLISMSNLPEINIGANLQIFLLKENVPLLPSHRETLYPNQLPRKSVPPAKPQGSQTTQLNSNLKENEQMKKLCRYSIIDNNKPKEKLARLGETWNHKSRMTVCAISWRMP